MLLLYDANPVFGAPASLQFREALAKIPYIVSFGSFVDETSAFADLILPDHAPLESWVDHIAESGASESVISIAPPAVHPLHNTRAMPDVLLDVAQRVGGPIAAALPWKSYDAMLRAAYVPLRQHWRLRSCAIRRRFLEQNHNSRRLVGLGDIRKIGSGIQLAWARR